MTLLSVVTTFKHRTAVIYFSSLDWTTSGYLSDPPSVSGSKMTLQIGDCILKFKMAAHHVSLYVESQI